MTVFFYSTGLIFGITIERLINTYMHKGYSTPLVIAIIVFVTVITTVLAISLQKKPNNANTEISNNNTAAVENTNNTSNANTSTETKNTFNYSTVKVGDRIGPMTVTVVSPYSQLSNDVERNLIVGFSGVVTLTGRISSRVDEIGNQLVYFTDLDEKSDSLIPRPQNDSRPFSVYFTNIDDVSTLFPVGTSQVTTLRIDNYMITSPDQFYSYTNPLRILGSARYIPTI